MEVSSAPSQIELPAMDDGKVGLEVTSQIPRSTNPSSFSVEQELASSVPRSLHQHYIEYYHGNNGTHWRRFFLTLLSSFVGTVVTFWFQHSRKIGSVTASATIGVLANSLPTPFREIVFCGSFAGMGGHVDGGGPLSYGSACGLGLLVGIVFQLLATRFNGAGGKLGTIAFVSGVIVACIAKATGVEFLLWRTSEPWANWTPALAIGAILAAGLGCALTVGLMAKSPPLSSTTLASATTGLAATVLLSGDWLTTFEFKVLGFFAYTGSFAGMSAVTRVGSTGRIVLAGFGSGVFLLLLWPLCPGVGGKFGLSAMLSVLVVERIQLCMPVVEEGPECVKDEPKASEQSISTLARSVSKSWAMGEVALSTHKKEFDLLAWIPARAWGASSLFLARGGNEEAARTALDDSYGALGVAGSLDREKDFLAHHADLKTFLEGCCNLEAAANPPPSSHVSNAHEATAIFSGTLFEALRTRRGLHGVDELPLEDVGALLDGLDIPTVGLGSTVSAEHFRERVLGRSILRQRVTNMKNVVTSGAYH
mmetsp:Transcript_39059/g.107616  ORF Transcript_39059/g.107616 Transcript_39059/m.107616 type:complete len:537 (-) Transcript_39059:96-1706(-)